MDIPTPLALASLTHSWVLAGALAQGLGNPTVRRYSQPYTDVGSSLQKGPRLGSPKIVRHFYQKKNPTKGALRP